MTAQPLTDNSQSVLRCAEMEETTERFSLQLPPAMMEILTIMMVAILAAKKKTTGLALVEPTSCQILALRSAVTVLTTVAIPLLTAMATKMPSVMMTTLPMETVATATVSLKLVGFALLQEEQAPQA